MPSQLLVERSPGILTLTLSRPERRNALTLTMLEELCAELKALDPTTRVIILRGAGTDFSSGFDLAEGQEVNASLRHGELLVDAQMFLAEASQICIGVASGYALAGGGAILAACDQVFATEDAKFGYPVLKVGIVPTPGMPFLRHELRDRDFRSLVLGGELISGKRAEEIGLVNRCLPTLEQALQEAQKFAAKILESSPAAVSETKRFTQRLLHKELRAEMDEALEAYKRVRKGPEAAEGLRAFAEKRKPSWN